MNNNLMSGLREPDPPREPENTPPGLDEGPEATEPQAMDQTALVFLEDPLARRLAVAWQACGGDEDEWLLAAGIAGADLSDADRLCKALRANGICREGGVTDKLALGYIRALVTEPLRKGLSRGKGRRR